MPAFGNQNFDDLFGLLPSRNTIPKIELNLNRLEDCYVVFEPGADGIIFDRHGHLVHDTTLFSGKNLDNYSLHRLRNAATRLNSSFYVGVDSGWWNYYHWIVLLLCKASIIEQFLPKNCNYLFPDLSIRENAGYKVRYSHEVWHQTLLRFGYYNKANLVKDGIYHVREAYFSSIDQAQPAFLTYMDHLFDRCSHLVRNIGIKQEPIVRYVVRRSDNPRLTTQADRVCRMLCDKFDYQPIYLENLDFYQQVSAFSKAKLIISPHGAGLSNLLFAGSNAKVLEMNSLLENEDFLRPWFFLIASGQGQRYSYINTTTNLSDDEEILNFINTYDKNY